MTGHYILLAAASTAADAVEAAERDLTELSQIKPGMIKQMLEGLGPSLMSLGWKLFIALILFLAGRKLIRFVQRMMSASFERTGVEIGVSKFLRSLTEFSLYALLVFIILGQLGVNTTSILAVLGTASLALSLSLLTESFQFCRRRADSDDEALQSRRLYCLHPWGRHGFDDWTRLYYSGDR